MKKNKILLLLFIALLFIASSFIQKNINNISVENKWSGFISYKSIFKHTGKDDTSQIKTEWNYYSESAVNADFLNNGGHAVRTEKTKDWLKTITPFTLTTNQVEESTKEILCRGQDTSEVSVEIDFRDVKDSTDKNAVKHYKVGYYWITCSSPYCSGPMTTTYSNTTLQLAGQLPSNETIKTEYQGS